MKYIRTPTGEIIKYDECDIFDDNSCEISEVKNQEELSKELFENTGILIGELKRR